MGIYLHYGLSVICIFATVLCQEQGIKSQLGQCHGRSSNCVGSDRKHGPSQFLLGLPRLHAVKVTKAVFNCFIMIFSHSKLQGKCILAKYSVPAQNSAVFLLSFELS